jgi:hypothetical protein
MKHVLVIARPAVVRWDWASLRSAPPSPSGRTRTVPSPVSATSAMPQATAASSMTQAKSPCLDLLPPALVWRSRTPDPMAATPMVTSA